MEKVKASTLLNLSIVAFGISGARGLVTDFASDICAAYTTAFYKPVLTESHFFNLEVLTGFADFKSRSDVIASNRIDAELVYVETKV
jgi:hypothetical protein